MTARTSPASSAAPAVPEGEKNLGRSSSIMALGTLLSRILGFVRAILLTVAIGSTALVADIFESANTIPNVIYMLLAGGIFNVVLVPQLIKRAKEPDRGADYTSRLLTLTVLIMAAATVAVTLCAAPIMLALTSGWSPGMLALGTVFALWTLPQIFFYGLYAVVGQVLNAHGRFGAYMWAPVLNNVVAIAAIGLYLVMFGRYAGTDQLEAWTATQTWILAGGHTLGIIAQALILFVPLKRLGLGLRPRFGWKGMGLRATGKIAGYTLVAMVIGNLVSMLTGRLVTGATAARESLSVRVPGTEHWSEAMAQAAIPGMTAYSMANLVAVLPHSVFVVSMATVLFNRLARSLDAGDLDAVRRTLTSGLRMFTVPVMLSTAAIVVLAGPIGRVFGSTHDQAIAAGTAIGGLLLIFAFGIPFRAAAFYMLRVFYAAEDARTPMLIQVSSALAILAATYIGAIWLPAWALAYWVAITATGMHVYQSVMGHLILRRRFGDYGFGSVLDAHATTGLAGLVAAVPGAVVVWLLGGYSGGFAWDSIPSALLTCAAAGAVMAGVYLVTLMVLRLPELNDFLARVPGGRRLVRR